MEYHPLITVSFALADVCSAAGGGIQKNVNCTTVYLKVKKKHKHFVS